MTRQKAVELAKWNLTDHPRADPSRVFYRVKSGQWMFASEGHARLCGYEWLTCEQMAAAGDDR